MGFLFIAEMQPISRLFILRENLYKELLAEIKLDDVKDEGNFKRKVDDIKWKILFDPIRFSEPKIVNHYGNGPFYIDLRFYFTGNDELFSHYSDEYIDNDCAKDQPTENYIEENVEIHALDKDMAISYAKEQFEDTRNFINLNNKKVIEWNNSMETKIDFDLDKRRREIIALYS